MAFLTSELRVVFCFAPVGAWTGCARVFEFGRHRFQFIFKEEANSYVYRGRISAPRASHGFKAHR